LHPGNVCTTQSNNSKGLLTHIWRTLTPGTESDVKEVLKKSINKEITNPEIRKYFSNSQVALLEVFH
jgi:hypothetical protein